MSAVHGNGGPLGALAGSPFDAVVLGWASFSHLTDPAAREALLAALRSLAPAAPVLLSYLGPDDDGRANGRVERLRDPIRRTLARVAGRAPAAAGEGFVPGAGFYQRFMAEEIERMAAAAGYEVAMHEREPYPHALLAPGGSAVLGWVWDDGPLPRCRAPYPRAQAPFGTQVDARPEFKPTRAMTGGARCARGLETRGNDGFGEGSPEVRRRTALVSRAISE